MESPVIIFPHLGIEISNLPNGFSIGNFRIAFYGVLIAIGMILAVLIAMHRAKKTNQYPDHYVDIGIISIICSIVGARLYYVIFSLKEYTSFWQIFNIRQGGLAIYGGLIGGILAAYFVCRYKKISFLRAMDTAVPGIALAQAIGRWGNFFNKEAYGGYTDSLFAMQIKYSEAGGVVSEELLKNMVEVNGVKYIQVHPTYLYESAWCLLLFIILMLVSRLARYKGEILLWYLGGYAIERAIVEGFRTDQLRIGETIPVSQLLSIAIVAAAFVILLINRIRIWSHSWEPDYKYVLDDGDPGTKAHYDELKAKRSKKKKSQWETYTVDDKDGAEDTEAEETKAEEPAEEDLPEDPATAAEEAEAAAEAKEESE
ncbi:MAG: prolipoprotein diacylglyceryl transferase [Lachnospiraceae bacterium]|nr:prolipoprotein diacylglyceryl transferase [Lachnospiraceae bacterium]